jgi:transketolase
LVVAEEHLAHGGLGSVVAMAASRAAPVPMAYVNLGDRYAESGDPEGLLEKYGLTPAAIVSAVRSVVPQ